MFIPVALKPKYMKMSEKFVQKCSACVVIFTAYNTGPYLLKSIKLAWYLHVSVPVAVLLK